LDFQPIYSLAMRPSRIIALADAGAIGVTTALFAGSSALSIAYAAATVIVMWLSGAYRPRIYYRISTELPALVGQMTVSTLMVYAWPSPHRSILLAQLPLTITVVVSARLAVYASLRAMRARPGRSGDALILGADGRGYMIADALLRNRGCGINPIGFVDRHETQPDSPLPVVADLAHLEQVMERLAIRHLIVVDRADDDDTIGTALWHCQARPIQVWAVPPLFQAGAGSGGRGAEELWGVPFQHVRRPGQYTAVRLVKRGFDLSVAATMLLVLAPALAVVALAVRLSSRGPIFFRQKRVGQHGLQFELLKFRTMMINDDSDTMWSVHNDLRMTPIGRFLRRSCIDELPQIFNVIRGDMSLVGPRPERPYFDARFRVSVPNYVDRLRGPVGITGWAQIHGLRGDTSIADRTRFDNFYIEHWSPWLDVVIMVRTLTAVMQWVLFTDSVATGASEVRAETVARSPSVIPVNAGTNQP
jgi:exopolysaccharide biosynthesis polyprenyl glycosylphosphotransferase